MNSYHSFDSISAWKFSRRAVKRSVLRDQAAARIARNKARYDVTVTGKMTRARYDRSTKGKLNQAWYRASAKGKLTLATGRARHSKSDKYKESQRVGRPGL